MRSSISGSWAAGRMTVSPIGQGRGEHRVLRAHDRHEREPDLRAAEPSRCGREEVAVAVVDLGAQRAHGVDVQIDRSPPDPIAAGVADDDPAEPGEEWPEQYEAGPHLGRGLERHEQPFDVTRRDLVGVRRRVVDDDTEIAQRLGHDADVLDFRDVGEPAPLAGQRRGGEQLERRVLRAADGNRAAQRPAALDPEHFPSDRLRGDFPLKRPCVSHECHPQRGRRPSR